MSFVIHCGTSDCDWGKKMQALSEAQLDPRFIEHYAQSTGGAIFSECDSELVRLN